jgi:phosphoribosylformylglycinamidine synthase
MVGTGNTSTNDPSDAAVVVAKPTNKGLALTTDCNSRYVFADPYKGAMIAVSEAARNIVCSGGQPLGITNCLNFGNPYDPEVYYQFVQAIKGMGEACRRFETPVTGGNVSFYNQNPDGAVYPTPTIGMVGLLEDMNDKMTMNFKDEGDVIFLLGKSSEDINSSEYLQKIKGVEFSPAPEFDLETELKMQQKLAELIKNKVIISAHDVSEGGLFITLIESSFKNNLGFDVVASDYKLRKDGVWFGEAQSRVVVSVRPDKVAAFKKSLGTHPFEELGVVTSGSVEVDGQEWGDISSWKYTYNTAIEKLLGVNANN